MTVCGAPGCNVHLEPFPALWVTSTNPAVECCSQDCAFTTLNRRRDASLVELTAQARAENQQRRAS